MNVLTFKVFYCIEMFYFLLTSLFFLLTTKAHLVAFDQITCDKLETAHTDLDEKFGGLLETNYN